VDRRDAEYLTKDLQGKVDRDQIAALPDYVAIARIGHQIVRIRTYEPPKITGDGHRTEIVNRSRRLYCNPVDEVRAAVSRRSHASIHIVKDAPAQPKSTGTGKHPLRQSQRAESSRPAEDLPESGYESF